MRISSVLVLIQFSVPSCSQWFKYAEHWHIISAIGILQSKTISLQKTLRKTFFFFIRRPPETLLKTYKNTQLGIMLCVWYGFSTKRLNYLLEILKITFPDEKKTLLHKYANIFSFEVFFGGRTRGVSTLQAFASAHHMYVTCASDHKWLPKKFVTHVLN